MLALPSAVMFGFGPRRDTWRNSCSFQVRICLEMGPPLRREGGELVYLCSRYISCISAPSLTHTESGKNTCTSPAPHTLGHFTTMNSIYASYMKTFLNTDFSILLFLHILSYDTDRIENTAPNSSCFVACIHCRVEAGSNTSTVTLRVVGGDEKESLRSKTVKYGRESQGTRTRERLRWRTPETYRNDKLVLSSERVPHQNTTVTVKE
jgi:hypothetical protein